MSITSIFNIIFCHFSTTLFLHNNTLTIHYKTYLKHNDFLIVETEKLLCLGVLDNKTGLSSSRISKNIPVRSNVQARRKNRVLVPFKIKRESRAFSKQVLCLTLYFLG